MQKPYKVISIISNGLHVVTYHANYMLPQLLYLLMVVQYMLLLVVHLKSAHMIMSTVMIQIVTIGLCCLNQAITVVSSTC